MRRPPAPVALLIALIATAAAAGGWVFSPQEVSLQAYYTTTLAGSMVSVYIDGGRVGAFIVPATAADPDACILLVGCPTDLGSRWLLRGVHGLRIAVDNTTVLDRLFGVSGRDYAWFVVYWDRHAVFGIGDAPPLWL